MLLMLLRGLIRLLWRLAFGLVLALALRLALKLLFWAVLGVIGLLWRGLRAPFEAKGPRPRPSAPPGRLSKVTSVIEGPCHVTDGDGLTIDGLRLRLAGIDAPEHNHPFGPEAKAALTRLCHGQIIRAEYGSARSYDRVVATCYLPDGRDLGAELVRLGLALDWPRYSGGKYARLEPRGSRRRLKQADARQRGAA